MMEPTAAEHWGDIATQVLSGKLAGSVPFEDTRRAFGDFYRIDTKGNVSSSGTIQVINIIGPIGKYDFCGSPGTQSIEQAIVAANADNTIEAIILNMDSPGGMVDGTESLSKAVKASSKPVVAYGNLMASAAYWIASSADTIIADNSNNGHNSSIGSIGTMAMWMDQSKSFEMNGIKIHTVYARKSSEKNKMMEVANAGDYTAIKDMLDNLNESFLSAVQTNRAGKIDLTKENVFTGKVYDAKEAVKFGLVDKTGDFNTAVKTANQLIKQKQQAIMDTNARFQKALTAAKSEAFAVVEDIGFGMSEESLQNIESTLAEQETLLASLRSDLAAANEQLTSVDADNVSKTAEIDALKAEVVTLKAASAGRPSSPATGADVISADEEEKYMTSADKERKALQRMSGVPSKQ